MKNANCFPVALAILLFAAAHVYAETPNKLSDDEKKSGFELLFDGKNLDGWEHKNNWKVEDDAICWASKGSELTYKTKAIPDDFDLRFDWKVSKGANSGVYYRPGQYEYQVLDNKVHADGRNPRTSAASLYFCMAPAKDVSKPVGEWNSGRIVCQGTVIQHWLNGVKVVDFDYSDSKWSKEVEQIRERGAKLSDRGANLRLQDHGDPVCYRNLKLRTLPKGEKLDRTHVTPAEIPPEALESERKILESRKAKK